MVHTGKTWGADRKRRYGKKKRRNDHYNRKTEEYANRELIKHGELELSGWDRKWLDYQVGRCHGKVPYDSEDRANGKARAYTEKYGDVASSYKCPFCGKWHLTTHRWEERA